MSPDRRLVWIGIVLTVAFGVIADAARAGSPKRSLLSRGDTEFTAVAKSGSKIVAVGSSRRCRWGGGDCMSYYSPGVPLVARFTRTGKLDKSFNGKGFRLLDGRIERLGINGLAVRGDRSILVAYSSATSIRAPVRLVSLTRRGKPERDFGDGGSTVIADSGFSPVGGARGLIPLSGNRAAIAGSSEIGNPAQQLQFAVLGIDRSGNVDAAFGNNGIATIGSPAEPLPGDSNALAIQPGRGILALGSTDFSPDDGSQVLTAARFSFDGQLDPWFGTGGVTRFTNPPVSAIGGVGAPSIIPLGDAGIIAASDYLFQHCDDFYLRSIGPEGEYPGALFETGADSEVLPCFNAGDAIRVGDEIVAVGTGPNRKSDLQLPLGRTVTYPRTTAGTFGAPAPRRSLPARFSGFSNGVTSDRGSVVVAGSLLAGGCRSPWRPGGRCQVAALTRLTPDGRDRSFGEKGVATLRKGTICRNAGKVRCR